MESTETRLLEEWKANNELLKFYEDLKHKWTSQDLMDSPTRPSSRFKFLGTHPA